MTHTYKVEGMTCAGCVAKVKTRLLSNPGIIAADISLDEHSAVVSMQRDIPIQALQRTLGENSNYKIIEEVAIPTAGKAAERPARVAYKPLLLIGGFVAVVSLLTAHGNLMTGMNHFMAGFFLVFSFFKLLDLKGFASAYSNYDVIASKVFSWGYVYPFVELCLGLAFLTGVLPTLTLVIAVVIMGVGSIGVIQSVRKKEKIQCACLGAVFDLPMSTVTIVENILMVAMAATTLLMQ